MSPYKETIDLFLTNFSIMEPELLMAHTSLLLSDSQARLLEERSKKLLSFATTGKRTTDIFSELLDIIRGMILKVAVLAPTPSTFHRVKLGSVAGEPLNPNRRSVSVQVGSNLSASMDRPLVQDENGLSASRFPNPLDELDNLWLGDILCVNSELEVKVASFWRDAESANNREPVVLLGTYLDRRLASKRPRLPEDALEHKAALVEENDRLFFPELPVSLCAASPVYATSLRLGRLAPWLLARVSESSSPLNAGVSRPKRYGSLPQSASRLPERFSVVSTTGLSNRGPLGPAKAIVPTRSFAALRAAMDDGDGALPSMPPVRVPLPFVSSRVELVRLLRAVRTLPVSAFPLPTAVSPILFALLIVLDFHMVAYIIVYTFIAKFGIENVNKGVQQYSGSHKTPHGRNVTISWHPLKDIG